MAHTMRHSKSALAYFLIAAILGSILRISYTTEIPITYRYVVNAPFPYRPFGIGVTLTTLLYKLFLEGQGLEGKYSSL